MSPLILHNQKISNEIITYLITSTPTVETERAPSLFLETASLCSFLSEMFTTTLKMQALFQKSFPSVANTQF